MASPSNVEETLDTYIRKIQLKGKHILNCCIDIGKYINVVNEKKLYLEKGYKNIVDCMEQELEIKKTHTYNFIKLANRFGSSIVIEGYSMSQLLELVSETDEIIQSEFSPDMSVREIKTKKKNIKAVQTFEQSEPVESKKVQTFEQSEPVESKKVQSIEQSDVIDVEFVETSNSLTPSMYESRIRTLRNELEYFKRISQEFDAELEYFKRISQEFEADNKRLRAFVNEDRIDNRKVISDVRDFMRYIFNTEILNAAEYIDSMRFDMIMLINQINWFYDLDWNGPEAHSLRGYKTRIEQKKKGAD